MTLHRRTDADLRPATVSHRHPTAGPNADDHRPSAQFEHTVLVTDTGAEILTVTAAGDTAVGVPAPTLTG